jgi:hypothetical protein
MTEYFFVAVKQQIYSAVLMQGKNREKNIEFSARPVMLFCRLQSMQAL